MNLHSDPATHAAAVTKSDTTELAGVVGLYVGGAGNLVVTMNSGVDVTFPAVPVGSILPIRVTKVLATGSTATNIVALQR